MAPHELADLGEDVQLDSQAHRSGFLAIFFFGVWAYFK